MVVDSSALRRDENTGIASVHGPPCIDKIHITVMCLCATGSVRLVS